MIDDGILAILASDVHLSHRPPVARSAEPHWYDAMDRQLRQLRDLQREHACPVILAGDIFDGGWRAAQAPPELINFALASLPDNCYAIPGQHDLPHHRLDELRKSAFFTLAKAGKINYLAPGRPVEVSAKGRLLRLHGFPWGVEPRSIPGPENGSGALCLDVAVIHAYIWAAGKGDYPGADPEKRVGRWRERLAGYDVCHFGDNHVTVVSSKERPFLFNPGGYYRRRSDERGRQPVVGLLMADGSVRKHPFDCSQDKFLDPADLPAAATAGACEEVLAELAALADAAADFRGACLEYLDRTNASRPVRDWLLEAFDGGEVNDGQRRNTPFRSFGSRRGAGSGVGKGAS